MMLTPLESKRGSNKLVRRKLHRAKLKIAHKKVRQVKVDGDLKSKRYSKSNRIK